MFSRKKSFIKRKGFYILLAVILTFGYFINQELSHNDGNVATNVQTETPVDSSKQSNEQTTNNEKNNVENTSSGSINNITQDGGYYLVKEHNGIIKIFYYDSNGNESLVNDTNIAYSLIGEKDQELFKNGVIIRTNEELQNLLENFES